MKSSTLHWSDFQKQAVDTSQLEGKLKNLESALRNLKQVAEEVNNAWLELPEEVKQAIGLNISFTGSKGKKAR